LEQAAFNINFALMGDEFAVIAGRNSSDVLVLRFEHNYHAHFLSFDSDYLHSQARVSADGSRIMLFSSQGFRLYDAGGNLVVEQENPDSGRIFNSQHIQASGNLAVMYPDALIIYGGVDGIPVFEEWGLSSVFFAPDGISVLGNDGLLRLIDPNSGEVINSAQVGVQYFAAFAGDFIVDSAFLGERTLIGAGETDEGYFFAVSDNRTAVIYSGGRRQFSVHIVPGFVEAFFMPNAVVVSPMHGNPAVYDLRRGRLIYEFDVSGYLLDIFVADGLYISRFLAMGEGMFALLLNDRFRPIATLPYFNELKGGMLIFNYPRGMLRQSKILSLDELIAIANDLVS